MKEACTAAGIHRSSRIPSLDGLRAISIAMVLAGHAASGIPALRDRPLLLYTVFNGSRGVNVFFVISGFLITSLLLREDRLTGRISLRQFYIRRAFRILPPFWIFLGTIVLLWKLGAFETRWAHLAVAFTFLRDYIAGDWWTGHSWSLSVEEQFYLLWPAAMVLAGRRRSLWIASGLIVAAPAIRVLSHLFVTGRFGPIEFFMFHMRVDSLMFGCALALVQNSPRLDGFAKRVLNWPGMLLALCFFLFLSGYLNYRFQGYYLLPFGYTFEAITISYLLLYFVRSPDSVGGRLLNSRFLVHVGVISYSLYLWQQLFLTDLLRSRLSNFPVNLIAAFVAAELSWRLVEQPALRLRQRFNGWRSSRSESAAKTVALLPTDSAEIAS
jgi:peptidoglycan/LPS O-acetylase OafA/YrhL